jgi:hypothetical protein
VFVFVFVLVLVLAFLVEILVGRDLGDIAS